VPKRSALIAYAFKNVDGPFVVERRFLLLTPKGTTTGLREERFQDRLELHLKSQPHAACSPERSETWQPALDISC
jgi:hypothetical protein